MDVKGFIVKEQTVNDDLSNDDVIEDLPNNDDIIERCESSEAKQKQQGIHDCSLASGVTNTIDITAGLSDHSYGVSYKTVPNSNSNILREDMSTRNTFCETWTDASLEYELDPVACKASHDTEYGFSTNQGLQVDFSHNDLTFKDSDSLIEGIVDETTIYEDSNIFYTESANSFQGYDSNRTIFKSNNINSCKKMESNSSVNSLTTETSNSTQLRDNSSSEDKDDDPLISLSKNRIPCCETLEDGEILLMKKYVEDEIDSGKSYLHLPECKGSDRFENKDMISKYVEDSLLIHTEAVRKEQNNFLPVDSNTNDPDLQDDTLQARDLQFSSLAEKTRAEYDHDKDETSTKLKYPNTNYEDSEYQESGNTKFPNNDLSFDKKILDKHVIERETPLQLNTNILQLLQAQGEKDSSADDIQKNFKSRNNHEKASAEKCVERNSVEVHNCPIPKLNTCEVLNLENGSKGMNVEDLPLQSNDLNLKNSTPVSELLSVTTEEISLKESSDNANFELCRNNMSPSKCISERSSNKSSSRQGEVISKRETETIQRYVADVRDTSEIFPCDTNVNKNFKDNEMVFSGFSGDDLDFTIEINEEFEISDKNELVMEHIFPREENKSLDGDGQTCRQENTNNSHYLTNIFTSHNTEMCTEHVTAATDFVSCSSETLQAKQVRPVECFHNLTAVESHKEQIFHDHTYSLTGKKVIKVEEAQIFHDHKYSLTGKKVIKEEEAQIFHDHKHSLIGKKVIKEEEAQIFHDHKHSLIGKVTKAEEAEAVTEDHTYCATAARDKNYSDLKYRSNLTLYTQNGPFMSKMKYTPAAVHSQTKRNANDECQMKHKPHATMLTKHGPLVVHASNTTLKARQATAPLLTTLTESNKDKLFLVTKQGIMSIQTELNHNEYSENTLHQFKADNPNDDENTYDSQCLSNTHQEKEQSLRNGENEILKTNDTSIPTPLGRIRCLAKYVHDTRTGTVSVEMGSMKSYILQPQCDLSSPVQPLDTEKPVEESIAKQTLSCPNQSECMLCNQSIEGNRQGGSDIPTDSSNKFTYKAVDLHKNSQKFSSTRPSKCPKQVVVKMINPGWKQKRNAHLLSPNERVVDNDDKGKDSQSVLDTKPSICQTIIPDIKTNPNSDGSYTRTNKLTLLRKFYHITKQNLKGKYLVVEGDGGRCHFRKLFSSELKDGVYLEVIYDTDKFFAECIAKQLLDPSFEIKENVPLSIKRRDKENIQLIQGPTLSDNTHEAEELPLKIGAVFTLNQECEENIEAKKEISGEPVISKSIMHRKPYIEIPRVRKIQNRCKERMWSEALKMYTIPLDEVEFWSWQEKHHDPWDDPKLRKFSRVVLKSLSLKNMYLKGIDMECSKRCRQEIVCLSLNAKIKKLMKIRKRICGEFGIPLRQISLSRDRGAFINNENASKIEINHFDTSEDACYTEGKDLENEWSADNLSTIASEEVTFHCDKERVFNSCSGVVLSEGQNENEVNLQTNEIKTESRSDDGTVLHFEKEEKWQKDLWNSLAVKKEPETEDYGDEPDDYTLHKRQKEVFQQIEFFKEEPLSEGYADNLDTVKDSNGRKRCFSEHETDKGSHGLSFVGQDSLNNKYTDNHNMNVVSKRYQFLGPSPNKIPFVNPSQESASGVCNDFSSKLLSQIKTEEVNKTDVTRLEIEAEAGVQERIHNLRNILKRCEEEIKALKQTMVPEDSNELQE